MAMKMQKGFKKFQENGRIGHPLKGSLENIKYGEMGLVFFC